MARNYRSVALKHQALVDIEGPKMLQARIDEATDRTAAHRCIVDRS
jgi:hypothetical protein